MKEIHRAGLPGMGIRGLRAVANSSWRIICYEKRRESEGEHDSRLMRALFFCLGCLLVGLAAVGVVLPLIPTTPFLLLAAACYARSSRRFYDWLLANGIFGPTIRQWQETRSVALRTKVVAIVLLILTLGSSVVFFVPLWPIKALLVAIGIWVVQFLVRLPTTPAALPGSEAG